MLGGKTITIKGKARFGKSIMGLASAFYCLAIATEGLNIMGSLFEKDELTEIIKEKMKQIKEKQK